LQQIDSHQWHWKVLLCGWMRAYYLYVT
jgi:hypothetical protein